LDVAAEYGEEWAYSAFQAAWAAAGSTGDRTFWIYAHSVTDDSWVNKAVTIHITEPSVAGAPAAAPAAPAAAQDRPASRAPNSSTNAAGQVRNPVTGLFETPNANQQGTTSGNQYSGQNISPYAAFGPYGQCGNHFNALSSPYSSQFGAPDPHNGYNNMLCGPSSQGGNQGPYYQAGVQTPYTQVGNQAPYNQVGYQTPTNQVGNQVSYNQAPYGGASCTPGQYGQQPAAYGSSTGGYGTGSGCQAYPTASVASGPTVTATAGADGTVTLTWAAVASATQYRVYRVSPSTSLLSTLQPSAGGATMGTVITGQAPGSAATFQVRAVSANGVETAVAASSVGSGSPALVAPQGTAR